MAIPLLEQTWRWFGPTDAVSLSDVRQAGAIGVVSALHHIPCGAVWPVAEIHKRKSEIESAGLRWSVVESVPVHEEIKKRSDKAGFYIENYCTTIRNLAACGIHLICYNFMAVTDWTRTSIAWRRDDGGESLRFDILDAAAFDTLILKRRGAELDYPVDLLETAHAHWPKLSESQRQSTTRTILMGLPGTVEDLSIEQFRDRLEEYKSIDSKRLLANLACFLEQVIPVAEKLGSKLAIHPDDPPFPIFGLPRIAGDEMGLWNIVTAVTSPSNGITFCTGSLGATSKNVSDLPGMLNRLGNHVHFLHLRNVRLEENGSFFEDDHLAGSTDMVGIMHEAIELMKRRGESIPMRPDHGRRMLGDLNKTGFYPGYSAIGRLRGLAELRGLELGLRYSRSDC